MICARAYPHVPGIKPLGAGSAVAVPWSVVRWVASIGLLCTGCFYVDPIEPHPKVTLIPASGEFPVVRGGELMVTAVMEHPDTFEWSAVACSDRFGHGCHDMPYEPPPPTSQVFKIPVPITINGGATDAPLTQSITVSVVARDDRGAVARGAPSTTYPVDDSAPILEVSHAGHRYVPEAAYPVGGPIDLIAKYSDPDDALADIALGWTVVAPSVATAPVPLSSERYDATHILVKQRLVPTVAGDWDVQVTATDPHGVPKEADLKFPVAPDHPPCLAQLSPPVPAGPVLPVSDRTLFRVLQVDDDLDAYPAVSSDPLYGEATFAWSIRPAGAAARTLVPGATGAAFAFDSAAFTPGDVVEVRVEAFDRLTAQVGCPDDQPTCAVTGEPSCVQRQTWRVEIR